RNVSGTNRKLQGNFQTGRLTKLCVNDPVGLQGTLDLFLGILTSVLGIFLSLLLLFLLLLLLFVLLLLLLCCCGLCSGGIQSYRFHSVVVVEAPRVPAKQSFYGQFQ
ncbi:unnamed protein product, partial [Polarella glacialis]